MTAMRTAVVFACCVALWGTAWSPQVWRLSDRVVPVVEAAAAQQRGGAGRGMALNMDGIKRGSYVYPGTDRQMEFAYFVSSKVDKKKKAPLVVALHGSGSPPAQVLAMIREQVQKNGYIAIAPSGESPSSMFGASGSYEDREMGETDVLNVLALTQKEYSVDESRIYVVGHSAGGAGAVHLGARKEIFAAFAAAAPALPFNPELLDTAKSPGLLIVADNDTMLPIQRMQPWAEKIAAMKGPHEYLVLKGAGHGGVVTQGGEQIFKFFAKHTKPTAAPAAQ